MKPPFRKALALSCLALCTVAGSALAQQTPSWMDAIGDAPMGAYRLHSDGASMGLGEFTMPKQAPLVYDGCLVAEDGVTPIVCASGDSMGVLPDGFVWRDDPSASPDAPRHCLWWEDGQRFVGARGTELCRGGALRRAKDAVPPVGQWAQEEDSEQDGQGVPTIGVDGASSF